MSKQKHGIKSGIDMTDGGYQFKPPVPGETLGELRSKAEMERDVVPMTYKHIQLTSDGPRLKHIPDCNWLRDRWLSSEFGSDCDCGADTLNAHIDRQAKEITQLSTEMARDVESQPDCGAHSIYSPVDREGCCVSCGEDLNPIAVMQLTIDRQAKEIVSLKADLETRTHLMDD